MLWESSLVLFGVSFTILENSVIVHGSETEDYHAAPREIYRQAGLVLIKSSLSLCYAGAFVDLAFAGWPGFEKWHGAFISRAQFGRRTMTGFSEICLETVGIKEMIYKLR